MNLSLYNAAGAMRAMDRWQETISDNLAAASSAGFKKYQTHFSAATGGSMTGGVQNGGPNAAGRVGLPLAQSSTDFSSGSFKPTGLATDLAIEGPGFFQVRLPDGTMAFTRDGELQWNAQGELVTQEGYSVVGQGGPIFKDPNREGPISVSAGGEISQGGVPLGRIQMVEFDDPARLNRISANYFTANDPNLQAGEAQNSLVRQGFLESSNASVIEEMAHMMTAMRVFEANQKVVQMHDQNMGKAISELGNPNL